MNKQDYLEQIAEMKNYISSDARCIKGVGLIALPEDLEEFEQGINLASQNYEVLLEDEERNLFSLIKKGQFAAIAVNSLAGLKRSFKIATKASGAVLIFVSDKLINQDDNILANADGVLRVTSLEV